MTFLRRWRKRRGDDGSRGVTLVELVFVSAVLAVLASVTVPVANTLVKRQKELELRQSLRNLREAIDRYQADVERGGDKLYGVADNDLNAANAEGYPEDLMKLVEGLDLGDAAGTKIKYLRRIPRDPITGKQEWGTRSSRDEPDSMFSDNINIFDVYSLSDKVGLDGRPYREW